MSEMTIQDVFHEFYPQYLEAYTPSPAQAKTAHHIMNCKTGAYGSNVSRCNDCGHAQYHHNSCRDRSCPMCQGFLKEKWVDAQKEYLLDAPYYHVVFTLPHDLNPLIYNNQKEIYALLFQTASETLAELAGDEKYLNARCGFISVLHTWSADMGYRPHLHLIVLGGGLDKNNNWHAKENGFFLPVEVISRVFKGKFMEGLKKLAEAGKLVFRGSACQYRNRYSFQELLDCCYGKEWAPYCKKTFKDALSVIEYLGRYTHRIAISNSRILSMDGETVTYKAKDYRNGGEWRTVTVPGVEFIRRFLMHVLPKGFVRIRHYGLLSSRCKNTKIALCRNLIGGRKYISELKGLNGTQSIEKLFGYNLHQCPVCGGGLSSTAVNSPKALAYMLRET